MLHLDLREIPAVYLNLTEHTEKNESMQKLIKDCGFKNSIRVEGVPRPDNPLIGCSLAHLKGLEEIDPPFILFEDDCEIKNFEPEIEVPENADAVYLGVSSWGRMNGHSGPFVQYEKVSDNFHLVYNMLGAHAILYLTEDYVRMCQRVSFHAGNVIGSYQDIGFAEIQRWFNVYTFDDPMFYQTSSYQATVNPLTSYPTQECFNFNRNYFLPERVL